VGRVLKKLLGVVFTSPVTLAMWAWVLLMTVGSVAVTVAIPKIFWEAGHDMMRNGLTLGDAGLVLFMVAFFVGGAAFTYAITWVSAKAAWSMGKGLVEDMQGVATATREVLTERADLAEAREAQGGMLSMSAGEGAGGELTQVSPANDGLELFDEGVALDFDEEGRAVAVEEREAEVSA
jgi:uncharacterized membrane protein